MFQSKYNICFEYRYTLSRINATDPDNLVFFDETDRVHSDEKWYYLQDLKKRLKVFRGQSEALADTTQHKSHRTQVMITTALSQPTNDFDGKCGIQIHTNAVAAQRSSVNRPAGKIHDCHIQIIWFLNEAS